MVIYDDIIGLESFIQRAIHISQRLTACALDQAFLHLKEAFCTAPIMAHPDPNLPFVVKVNTFKTRVRAELSH